MTLRDDLADIRLEAALNSQRRIRAAFLAVLLSSSIVLLIGFDSLLSWNGGFPDPPSKLNSPGITEADKVGMTEAFKERIKHFFDRTFYTVPALGIPVSTDDIGFIAPLICFLTVFYYSSTVRTASFTMAELRKSVDQDNTIRIKTFAVLQGEMVLNSLAADEELESTKPPVVYRSLIFLPVFASLLAVFSDVRSYVQKDWADPNGRTVWENFNRSDAHKTIAFDSIGVVLALITAWQLVGSYRQLMATRKTVLSFKSGTSHQ
jgi:hypothetical protein